eukprot:m.72872 g.72872  ORF g.72872 m.72872 type:complete len:277 (+) comp50258_c0_seq1:52-882(+)
MADFSNEAPTNISSQTSSWTGTPWAAADSARPSNTGTVDYTRGYLSQTSNQDPSSLEALPSYPSPLAADPVPSAPPGQAMYPPRTAEDPSPAYPPPASDYPPSAYPPSSYPPSSYPPPAYPPTETNPDFARSHPSHIDSPQAAYPNYHDYQSAPNVSNRVLILEDPYKDGGLEQAQARKPRLSEEETATRTHRTSRGNRDNRERDELLCYCCCYCCLLLSDPNAGRALGGCLEGCCHCLGACCKDGCAAFLVCLECLARDTCSCFCCLLQVVGSFF